jgi:hypothetical protein
MFNAPDNVKIPIAARTRNIDRLVIEAAHVFNEFATNSLQRPFRYARGCLAAYA